MIHKHFKTKAKFNEELQASRIAESDICFIKDSKEIWTHGVFYAHQDLTEEDGEILTAAITELDSRVTEVSGDLEDLDSRVTDNELVTAAAINDLSVRCKNLTWSALKTLRDNSQLIPGQWYRITDYQCTTTRGNAQSAGHQFDIIVRADSTDTLNENAYAAKHAGDTYFANSNLAAWELKYTLDNINWSLKPSTTAKTNYSGEKSLTLLGEVTKYGQTYYSWKSNEVIAYGYIFTVYTLTKSSGAKVFVDMGSMMDIGSTLYDIVEDTSQGKGTITYLKDEYNNECPYDFKNIQFKVGAKEEAGTVANVFYYTFSVASGTNDATVTDHSLNGFYCYNNRIAKWITDSTQTLNFNVFRNTSTTALCSSNTFGSDCYSNTFGKGCYSNTFGKGCYNNTFGNYCHSNTFGNDYQYNIFGNGCCYNKFRNSCDHNTFGDDCDSNTFGNHCRYNIFGDNCSYNIFGDNCHYNKFGTSSSKKSYCQYIIVENGNQYIYLNCSATTSASAYFQNVKIAQGVNNTSTHKTITHTTAGDTFQTIYKPVNSVEVSV